MSEKKQQYLRIEFTWMDSPNYRKIMCACKGIEMVFNLLRRYVIRDFTNDKIWQRIFHEFYCKNILASAITYDFIMEKTGMNKRTLIKCLKTLEDAGYIKRKRITFDGGWASVFILGKRKPYVDDKNEPAFVDWWKVDDRVDEELSELRTKKNTEG